MKTLSRSEVDRLQAIKDEVKDLMAEAWSLVRGTREEASSKAYWYGHIVSAIDDDHMYVGGCSPSFDDTIVALKEALEEDEDEEEDES
jgi:hypothetical protein